MGDGAGHDPEKKWNRGMTQRGGGRRGVQGSTCNGSRGAGSGAGPKVAEGEGVGQDLKR